MNENGEDEEGEEAHEATGGPEPGFRPSVRIFVPFYLRDGNPKLGSILSKAPGATAEGGFAQFGRPRMLPKRYFPGRLLLAKNAKTDLGDCVMTTELVWLPQSFFGSVGHVVIQLYDLELPQVGKGHAELFNEILAKELKQGSETVSIEGLPRHVVAEGLTRVGQVGIIAKRQARRLTRSLERGEFLFSRPHMVVIDDFHKLPQKPERDAQQITDWWYAHSFLSYLDASYVGGGARRKFRTHILSIIEYTYLQSFILGTVLDSIYWSKTSAGGGLRSLIQPILRYLRLERALLSRWRTIGTYAAYSAAFSEAVALQERTHVMLDNITAQIRLRQLQITDRVQIGIYLIAALQLLLIAMFGFGFIG